MRDYIVTANGARLSVSGPAVTRERASRHDLVMARDDADDTHGREIGAGLTWCGREVASMHCARALARPSCRACRAS